MKLKMETPYRELTKKYSNPSKHQYMISELIDNSIGSWKNKKLSRELKIELIINSKDGFIQCTDNAAGMDEETLGNSVRMNKENNNKNDMNMYGVGLKNCAFWLGKDLKIETNDGFSSHETEISISKIEDSDLDKTIEWEVKKGKKIGEGTTVNISNIYPQRILKNPKKIETYIKDFWSTKYMKYLDKGTSINIIFIDENGEETFLKIPPKIIKTQIIPFPEIQTFLNIIKKNDETPRILKNIKEDAQEKASKGEKLEFNYEIPFKACKNCKLDFTFGIQEQFDKTTNETRDYKKNFGLTTFQGGRAINVAPTNPLSFGEYTRSNIKRVYGFVELGDFFQPDNNKQDFIFGNLKEPFQKLIDDIGRDLLIIANSVFDTIGKKVNTFVKENGDNTIKKLGHHLDNKTNISWEITKTGAKTIMFKDISVTIEQMSSGDNGDEESFISSKIVNNNKKEIHVKYNAAHQIWKPITNNNSSIDVKNVLYPLVAILGVSNLALEHNLVSDILGQKDIDNKDYLSIISSITKAVIK